MKAINHTNQILAALNHEETDTIPCYTLGQNDPILIQKYNLLIKEFEEIGDWPFNYSLIVKLIGYCLSPIITFLISQILDHYIIP